MADRIIVACTFTLAIIYLIATSELPRLQIGDPLGPRAFPYLLGIGLLIASGLLLLENWRKKKRLAQSGPVYRAPRESLHHLFVIAAVSAVTCIYIFVLESLGYLVATAIYLFLLMAYFNRGEWLVNAIATILFCVGTYALFDLFLGIALPSGFFHL